MQVTAEPYVKPEPLSAKRQLIHMLLRAVQDRAELLPTPDAEGLCSSLRVLIALGKHSDRTLIHRILQLAFPWMPLVYFLDDVRPLRPPPL